MFCATAPADVNSRRKSGCADATVPSMTTRPTTLPAEKARPAVGVVVADAPIVAVVVVDGVPEGVPVGVCV